MRTIVANAQPRLLGGWKPDTYDHRDFVLRAPAPDLAESSLRPDWKLAVRNQGGRGTCTANASLEAEGFLYTKDGKPDPVLSRLFTYWVTRVRIANESALVDGGCQIRNVMTGLAKYGSCPESMWVYSDDDTTFTLEPNQACFDAAALRKALFFYRCPDLNTVKASIAQGFPVLMGFSVPENFMSEECAATGVIKMPSPTENMNEGHCMVFAGWSDARQQLDGPNSWGEDWGDNGWFHMPYEMMEDGFVGDCWTVRRVQE